MAMIGILMKCFLYKNVVTKPIVTNRNKMALLLMGGTDMSDAVQVE